MCLSPKMPETVGRIFSEGDSVHVTVRRDSDKLLSKCIHKGLSYVRACLSPRTKMLMSYKLADLVEVCCAWAIWKEMSRHKKCHQTGTHEGRWLVVQNGLNLLQNCGR